MIQMEKLKKALRFICSSDFWRMALFWNMALLFSYFQLLKKRIFASKSSSSSCSNHSWNSSHKPICVITGATSGLGKATKFALSRKGFYVVLDVVDMSQCIQYLEHVRVSYIQSESAAESYLNFAVGRSSHLLSKLFLRR